MRFLHKAEERTFAGGAGEFRLTFRVSAIEDLRRTFVGGREEVIPVPVWREEVEVLDYADPEQRARIVEFYGGKPSSESEPPIEEGDHAQPEQSTCE